MGVEADIRALTDADRSELAAAIAFYKHHRHWLHDASTVHLDVEPTATAHGLVARDGSVALFLYAVTGTPRSLVPPPLRLRGLDHRHCYEISRAWPQAANDNDSFPAAGQYTGTALLERGLPLPVMKPETLKLLLVRRCET